MFHIDAPNYAFKHQSTPCSCDVCRANKREPYRMKISDQRRDQSSKQNDE